MTLKSTTTKFNFSYGELLQQALEKSTFFRRDESILAQRGVTSNNLDVFDDLITAFRETKEDNIFLGLISDAIQKRDDKRKQVELIGRDIVGIAETVYGSKSGIYKSFGFTSSKSLNDGEFLIAADTLHSKATEYSATPIQPVYFNFNIVPQEPCSLYVHEYHIIQNIYFMNNDVDVFVSGKFTKTDVRHGGISYGGFDMPYSIEFSYNNLIFQNLKVYKTAQTFSMMLPSFLSYDRWNTGSCPGQQYPQFFTASNTLPCLSNCQTDEFVTVTLDRAGEYGNLTSISEDKAWIFSNDNSVCGRAEGGAVTEDIFDQDHFDIENDNIEAIPELYDLEFINSSPEWHLFDCIQYTPAP